MEHSFTCLFMLAGPQSSSSALGPLKRTFGIPFRFFGVVLVQWVRRVASILQSQSHLGPISTKSRLRNLKKKSRILTIPVRHYNLRKTGEFPCVYGRKISPDHYTQCCESRYQRKTRSQSNNDMSARAFPFTILYPTAQTRAIGVCHD
ncbi:hypothetical protein ABW19_dt0207179 [Dactylella cylindrospora]|nr:hypothetical protein ABW19_dt0207179 [Dactylella cylindrospora]